MTDDTANTTVASHTITRRRVLAGVAAGATGAGALAHLSGDASAQADVSGDFDATGDDATLGAPPAAVRVDATGEYAIDATGPIDQVRTTLQATVADMTDDLTHTSDFGSTSGEYALTADVIADHRDIEAGDFMPASGASKTTDVRVRVVTAAVRDGSVIAEDSVEATVPIVVDHEGVVVSVGGSADVTIEPA